MPSIADAMTPAAFAKLDGLCLAKLLRIDLSEERGIERKLDDWRATSGHIALGWRDRAMLYQTCYRFRAQIGDTRFIARVLIAKAEADPLVRREGQGAPRIRSWAAENPFVRRAPA